MPQSVHPRILVVDDEIDTCCNLQDILTDLGYEVETAHNGLEALTLVRDQSFDVALLDLKMPGMDGLTLYREIKRIRADTVAIIVTAYATGNSAEEALHTGAWHVLSKPIDLERLLPLVETAARQPVVMIVDDDTELCGSLWDVLHEQGYRVCLAHNGNEAEEQIRFRSHRVVLIDMRLPEGSGGSVYQSVRRSDPESRVILITGFRDELQEVVDQIISEGADAICYKPFQMELLLDTIQRLAQMES